MLKGIIILGFLLMLVVGILQEKGYKLPKIVFWNVAGDIKGVPATNFDNDVVIVSGFSTTILEKLVTLEEYRPVDLMMETLEKYIKIIESEET